MGIVSVYNRKLKNVDYSIVMCYHGMLGTTLTSLFVCIEAAIRGGEFRFYTPTQYLLMMGVSLFDVIAVNGLTISYQRDSSGFVSLISYSLIFYGFLSDILIFDEQL